MPRRNGKLTDISTPPPLPPPAPKGHSKNTWTSTPKQYLFQQEDIGNGTPVALKKTLLRSEIPTHKKEKPHHVPPPSSSDSFLFWLWYMDGCSTSPKTLLPPCTHTHPRELPKQGARIKSPRSCPPHRSPSPMSSIRRRAFLRTLNFHTARAPTTTSVNPSASERPMITPWLSLDESPTPRALPLETKQNSAKTVKSSTAVVAQHVKSKQGNQISAGRE